MNSIKIAGLFFAACFITIAGCKKENFTSRDTSGLKPTPIDTSTPPPPVDPTIVVFDAADKLDETWEIVGPKEEDKAGKKEGEACLKSTIVAAEDYMHFIKRRPTTVDPNLSVDDGQFVFWFYVNDASQLKDNDGQIELTSSGQSDKNEYSWNLDQIIPHLQNGWNEIKCNFSTAQVSNDGGPDIHAFNFFRIYLWAKSKPHDADVIIKLDYLRFQARTKISVQFASADTLNNTWEIVGPAAEDKSGKKEGAACLKSTILTTEDYMHFIYRRPSVVNAGVTKDNGQFRFWFYVNDVSQLKDNDGQIELTSSGQSDKNEYSWNLDKIIPNLQSGWNELKLNFSDAAESNDGGVDVTAINFFRIYFWAKSKPHDSDIDVKVDDLRIQEK